MQDTYDGIGSAFSDEGERVDLVESFEALPEEIQLAAFDQASVPRRSGQIGKQAALAAIVERLSPEHKIIFGRWLHGLSDAQKIAILG